MVFPNEEDVVRSNSPLPFEENEEICVNGNHGFLMNRGEIEDWRGTIPINQYDVNVDDHPEIINKPSRRPIKYIQNVYVKYLKPPTPQPHGDLVIRQEPDLPVGPAPPVIIRQIEPRPPTPDPIVYREKPPCAPEPLPQQFITIPGKRAEPPARRLIIERVPQQLCKGQSVIIEKWLPYERPKRRVVFEPPPCLGRPKPRNLIIQWHFPNKEVETEVKYLDAEYADPSEYVRKHGCTLKDINDLPKYDYFPQNCPHLNAHEDDLPYKLEGDLNALHLLDAATLERLGLSKHVSIKHCNQAQPLLPVPLPPAIQPSSHCAAQCHGHNKGLCIVELRRCVLNGEYGVVIRGGAEFSMSLYVLRLVENGCAHRDGRLKAGDEIIQINGQVTSGMRLIEAVELIKAKDTVSFLVKRTGLPPPTISDVIESMKNGFQI